MCWQQDKIGLCGLTAVQVIVCVYISISDALFAVGFHMQQV